MNPVAPGEDERLFLRRLSDLHEDSLSGKKPRFTHFLNERQQWIADAYIRQTAAEHALLFGGYEGAVRCVCGFFSVYDPADPARFPLTALTARYRRQDALTHRDFLGALMALGIKREAVGDIHVGEGVCTLFVLDSVAQAVAGDLDRVGRVGVRVERGFAPENIPEQSFEDLAGTVRSPRMDSLVRLITGFSREKSAGLIQAELVQRNYCVVQSISEAFIPGDIISIRGFGKYRIDGIGAPTRKGRLPVTVQRYM